MILAWASPFNHTKRRFNSPYKYLRLYKTYKRYYQANTMRWASVVDDGPTSAQHWAYALCVLGILSNWNLFWTRIHIAVLWSI